MDQGGIFGFWGEKGAILLSCGNSIKYFGIRKNIKLFFLIFDIREGGVGFMVYSHQLKELSIILEVGHIFYKRKSLNVYLRLG